MPVNPDLLTRSFAPTAPYLVGREKVREFARAVFSTDPRSVDLDAAHAAGAADLVAPPTFVAIVQQAALDRLLGDSSTGIEFDHVVHGEQRFAYAREIVAGDELTGTIAVTALRGLGDSTMLMATTTIADASGATIVTATATIFVSIPLGAAAA